MTIFKTKPYKHQQEAFDRLKFHSYFALLADMGTGKSKIAIDISAYKHKEGLHDRMLIIAPTSVHPQWVKEQLPLHCGVNWRGFSYSSNKTIKFLKKMDSFLLNSKNNSTLSVFTMNFEAFTRPTGLAYARHFINTSKLPPIIIIDEASRIKNPEAKTVKSIKKLRDLYPNSLRIVLTGTPAAKSPVDMWSIFDFLAKDYMGCSYLAFQHEHTIMIKRTLKVKNRTIRVERSLDHDTYYKIRKIMSNNRDSLGKISPYAIAEIKKRFGISEKDLWLIVSSEGFKRAKNTKQLQEKISPVTFSVSRADCLDLPEKIYEEIHFELNKEQKTLIKNLTKYSAVMYQGKELTIEVKALLGLRVLQICGGFFSHHTDAEGEFESMPIKGKNRKLEYLIQDLQEIGTQQFIVWAVFTKELKLIAETLRKDYAIGVLAGFMDKEERNLIVEAFKAGELQGLISHPEVGGYGLNLQGATIQYWYSRNYRTEARLQAEDRSHRIGTVKSPIYKDLLYNVNFENQVLQSLREGKDINSNFLSQSLNEMCKIT